MSELPADEKLIIALEWIDQLRAALKPFTEWPLWRDTYPDAKIDTLFSPEGMITAENIRAARRAWEAHSSTSGDNAP